MSLPGVARPRRRVRWRWVLAALGLLPVVALVGLGVYLAWSADRRLRAAIAEADRLDPGWRLEQIEANREKIPSEEDSALRALAALDHIPSDWLGNRPMPWTVTPEERSTPPRGQRLVERIDKLPPGAALPPDLAAGLRAELDALAPAVTEGRKLAELPRGRHLLRFDPVIINTLLPHAQRLRSLAQLLRLDALRRADEGDLDGALESCRAIVNAARSIGDEPFIISQLVRIAIDGQALETLERVLATRGTASDAALARLQGLLADEAHQPFALVMVRGERAGSVDLLDKLADGRIAPAQLASALGGPGSLGMLRVPVPGFYRYNEALVLEQMNRAVEVAKRPPAEQLDLWHQWEMQARRPDGNVERLHGMLAHLLLPALSNGGQAALGAKARLDCGVVMIALERHRLAHGGWPGSLDALKPLLGGELPLDPYSGRPLRLARGDDGWTIYSVGPDRKDDGGKLAPRFQTRPDTDWGYRLLDPDRRGQVPIPKGEGEEEPEGQ